MLRLQMKSEKLKQRNEALELYVQNQQEISKQQQEQDFRAIESVQKLFQDTIDKLRKEIEAKNSQLEKRDSLQQESLKENLHLSDQLRKIENTKMCYQAKHTQTPKKHSSFKKIKKQLVKCQKKFRQFAID